MMSPVKARVKNGRLVLDEPTDLPEGAVVTLSIDDDDVDELTDEERPSFAPSCKRPSPT